MDNTSQFVPFTLWGFLTGTLIYTFREFYTVLLNISKFGDGRTGYMNYGFWEKGSSTKNPHATLVKAVIDQLDVQVLNKHAKNGQVHLLEIGCGLGQSAIDAVNSLGSNVNVTGISISQAHVSAANKLAASAGLSSVITHYNLDAKKLNTLQDVPFSGAYSCEVLAEIPDEGLRACFAALHDILPPGAEFSYADIVKTETTSTSRGKPSSLYGSPKGFFSRLGRLIAPTIVTMMFGDNWRTVSKYNTFLTQAGFVVTSTESIGDRVFVPTWDYAKERMEERPDLGVDRPFLSKILKFITWGCLFGLASLWEDGGVDYVIVKAQRV